MVTSRVYSAAFCMSPSGWFSARLADSSPLIASTRGVTSASVSEASSPSCALSSSARWRAAAGTSIVLAIDAAVSASMLSLVTYCSSITS